MVASTASRFIVTASLSLLIVNSHVGATPDGSSAVRASSATYRLTFASTWDAATHPTDFPPNPHFSGLIGGTHDGAASFWQLGETASDGIESMAETGSKLLLQNEVQDAITAGSAEFIISGGGIAVSPGSVSVEFEVSGDFPLVTVVSMLAPSPDWFVGVSGLSLMEGGEWRVQVVVPLVVHDAGTDSGTSYRSANEDTDPPGTIAELTEVPFDMNNMIGTFTFELVGTVEKEPLPRSELTFDVSEAYPNPSSGHVTIDVSTDRPQRIILGLYDLSGRLGRREEAHSIGGDHRERLVMDARGLASQAYLLRVSGEHGEAVRAVIIRRR